MRVAGLDGWRGGWVVVFLDSGRLSSVSVAPTVRDTLQGAGNIAAIGVDMPIGLPPEGRRAADLAAREILGPRRSAVFLTPPRAVVETEPYAAANRLAKAQFGFGISKQAYMLRSKILEVDQMVRGGAVIHEVHPELAFRDLAGWDLASKRSYAGVRQRQRLLQEAGIELPADIGAAGVAPLDDVLDAAAVALVAAKLARGEARPIPDPPILDAAGVPMAIWR